MRAFLVPTSLIFTLACDHVPPVLASPTPELVQVLPADTEQIPDDTVIAEWNGGQLSMADLREELSSDLSLLAAETEYLTDRYLRQANALDQLVTDQLMELEAAAQGYDSPDALVDAVLVPRIPEPTEAEIEEVYRAYQRQLDGATLEEASPFIAQRIRSQNAQTVFGEYVEELQERYGLNSRLPFPDLPRFPVEVDDDPFLGAEDAPVEIVIFAEYQCPYCATVTPQMEELIEAYPGQLRVVFRDFPLDFHDRAIPAAVAANCAGEQGQYWEMHELLMANQRALTDSNFVSWANQLELDAESFSTCLSDPSQQLEIQADMADGQRAGVNGTPSIYINGMKSPPSPDALTMVIEREIAVAAAGTSTGD